MTDDQLEAALRALGTSIDVPEMPDITASVTARLSVTPRKSWKLRPVLTTVLAILVAFAVALAVSPEVRAGVAQFLKFAGIEFRSDTPPPLPTGITTTTQPIPGERVVSLDEARKEFPVIVPSALGRPKEVRIADGHVILVYDNASVDEFDGTISPILQKFVYGGEVEQVQVNGTEAYWVNGPHEVIYVDRDGRDRTETARMSAKTLIWQVDHTTLRLEGDFTKDKAISIAATG
jgi:hypothetical protein